jgi:hypothetical protein
MKRKAYPKRFQLFVIKADATCVGTARPLDLIEEPIMKTRRKLIIAALVCFTSGIVASAQPDRTADPAYAWVLNLTNSDFDETTDGKNYPSLFGGTSAWKQINGMTWEIPIKQDGKLINTTRRRARILESTVYVRSDAHIQLAPPGQQRRPPMNKQLWTAAPAT